MLSLLCSAKVILFENNCIEHGLHHKAADVRCQVWGLIGNDYCQMARYRETEQFLQRALDHAIATFGEEDDETGAARNQLGVLYKYTGDFDKAEKPYREALTHFVARRGEENPFAATLYHNLGGLEHARGAYAAGEPYAPCAVTTRKRCRLSLKFSRIRKDGTWPSL